MKSWQSAFVTTIGVLASLVAVWVFVSGRATLFPDDPTPDLGRTQWLGIQVLQGGRLAAMGMADDRTVKVDLNAAPIELRFPKHGTKDVYQLCAWTNKSIFLAIRPGRTVDDIDYFIPGTGIADTPYTSGTLFVENEAHNYLIGTRLGSNPDYYSVLYSRVSVSGQEHRLADYHETIYVVAFCDLNKNHTVDGNEYEFLILKF
jgi:hypothetical protein